MASEVLVRCDRAALGLHPEARPYPVVRRFRETAGGGWMEITAPRQRKRGGESGVTLVGDTLASELRGVSSAERREMGPARNRYVLACPWCGGRGDVVTVRQETLFEVLGKLRHAGAKEISLAALSRIVSARTV